MLDLQQITAKKFQGLIGTKAILATQDGKNIELTVTSIFELPFDGARPDTVRQDPFIIHLSGAHSDQTPDGIYAVSFEEIGSLELYVDNKSDDPDSEDFKHTNGENTEPKSYYHIVIG